MARRLVPLVQSVPLVQPVLLGQPVLLVSLVTPYGPTRTFHPPSSVHSSVKSGHSITIHVYRAQAPHNAVLKASWT